MPPSKRSEDELTPLGKLEEGSLHGVLGYQLAQAAILTTEVFMQAAGAPLALRPVEYTILQLVKENAAITPGRLAKALGMTAPGITIWLDRLEARELVKRERSETDRRAQNVSVTRKGKELVTQATKNILAEEREVLQALSEGERTLLLELLHKVARLRAR
ncbi:MarR family winged helix-turn-helix transcriptional regulator [Aquabacterium sp.]|uniref:MarR family winged helix-turn-helix transcriptional regulator n=1 Tax=Aquabacterium sp. TaxID=1872578 RepID=UPI002CDB5FAD|nr:MarR family transcriptional regulator [Aquabacterium sp.]HSW08937.1 MarR family transcriptional regulator [Aquabacterium sp.]